MIPRSGDAATGPRAGHCDRWTGPALDHRARRQRECDDRDHPRRTHGAVPGRPRRRRLVTPPPFRREDLEPLTAAQFTLSADGQPIAGVVRVSALELSGGGIGVTVAPVTITRLAGGDDVFHAWAHDVLGRGGERPTRNLVLTVHDHAGEPAAAWELLGVMPVAYSP